MDNWSLVLSLVSIFTRSVAATSGSVRALAKIFQMKKLKLPLLTLKIQNLMPINYNVVARTKSIFFLILMVICENQSSPKLLT